MPPSFRGGISLKSEKFRSIDPGKWMIHILQFINLIAGLGLEQADKSHDTDRCQFNRP
ncbi:hypothetical protein ACPPVU_24550 [Mucilaginibacter sp. McL0603]|uniref:hypothetical protein n=1 Tax=Mucilaginibacter sp. McL0603 TaxID=3415670 RepID=UPI003CE8781E